MSSVKGAFQCIRISFQTVTLSINTVIITEVYMICGVQKCLICEH